jgi:demethylmenaquinone methyltransferase/2-methoxy-6-polyprenyl-1,4-benzoquinol methylase
MFDEISPIYDFLNHFFSMGNDLLWRKKAVKLLNDRKYNPNDGYCYKTILDLAAGTGDLGREFIKLSPETLYSVDLSVKMLNYNRKKINNEKNKIILADAEHLPFHDRTIDLTGIAFGIRNFGKLQNCINEIHRVLTDRGLLIVIEMFCPERKTIWHKIFNLYFTRLVPILGNLISRSKYAYCYLSYSVYDFLDINEYKRLLENSGFEIILVKNNFLNFVYTVLARKKS